LIEYIQSNYDVKFYDFVKQKNDSKCPYVTSGGIQVWDFLKAIEQLEEQIYFKVRTDIWFTDTSIKVIIEYLDLIVNNKLDAAFFGLYFRKSYKDSKVESPFDRPSKKVFDWVSISNKHAIEDPNIIFDKINKIQKKDVAGHLCFYSVYKPNIRAFNVSTQMYLIRKSYEHIPNNYEVYSDFISGYSTIIRKWVYKNEMVINQF
jgi:hypothetical protein